MLQLSTGSSHPKLALQMVFLYNLETRYLQNQVGAKVLRTLTVHPGLPCSLFPLPRCPKTALTL